MRDVFDWLPPHTPATIRYGTGLSEPMAGGDGRDILFGKAGNDLLIGGGARDILVGGAGSDQFYFDALPLSRHDADVIIGFKPGVDAIVLDFAFLPIDPDKPNYGSTPDRLDPDSFTYGKGPKDADDFVIYRKKTGALFIDTDGKGPEAMHKIAILANKADIEASDIIVA